MKKFDRDKYLKKLKFKRAWRKYERYFYIGVPCLMIAILGIYFTYSKFSSSKEEEVVRTTVGEFIHGDVVIGAYIGGEYSKTIPGKNDGYVVKNVVCDNGAVGTWDNDKWGLLTTNMTKRSKCNVYFETKKTFAGIIEAASSDTSMFASDDADKNVRYIGANPNNYVYFNCSDYNNQSDSTCEKWRIIGVFNNVTKSDGTKENLVKIIRNDSLEDFEWDGKKTGIGTSTTNHGSNDWTDSQLMMMLNPTTYLKSGYTNSNNIISVGGNQFYGKMGSYYNGTSGCAPVDIAAGATFRCRAVDFTSTGLKNDITRSAIEEVVWNLGGMSTYASPASTFYTGERGTAVYSGHSTTWTGKIGLMYPSDYGYATSGGSTTNRATCLSTNLSSWNIYSDCYSNDYLFNSSYQWTLAPSSGLARYVFYVASIGDVNNLEADNTYGVRPALYLKSSISVVDGNGTSTSPYKLEM